MKPSAVTDAAGSMHGFPAALTSYVGRARVADEIAGQLGRYRLVTATWPAPTRPARPGWLRAGNLATWPT